MTAKNAKVERNRCIVKDVLEGSTLSEQARKYNVTKERIRQIVSIYCRKSNPGFLRMLQRDVDGSVSVFVLRKYAKFFIKSQAKGD